MKKMRYLRAFVVLVTISCLFPIHRLEGQAGRESQASPEVYVVPFSHLDLFWAGTREECLARGNRIIAKAIRIAKEYPEFRFLIEDNNFLANYVETHPGSKELEDLKRLVKEGRIEIAPKWAAIFQNLPDGEVHVRNLLYGKRYARQVFGADPQVAHLGDIPGYTPQFPQVLARAGVPFMVMTRTGPSDKSLFHWKSPDGSKVLVWFKGYGWGSRLGLHADMNEERRRVLKKELEDIRPTTPGPIYMSWGGDLWGPTEKLIANVTSLNTDSSLPRFLLSTPTDFFKRAAKTRGVPELSGEIPSAWRASMNRLWSLVVPATNVLLSAEKFAALNYALGFADYPQREFEFLWKQLLEFMDHNAGGQGGTIADDRKIGNAKLVILRGEEILRDMVRNVAEHVQNPVLKSHPIVVFNPSGWRRTDLVKTHVSLYGDVTPNDIGEYTRGMRLVDQDGNSFPFYVEQVETTTVSRGLVILFVAKDVPPLGYKSFYLVPAERSDRFASTAEVNLREPVPPVWRQSSDRFASTAEVNLDSEQIDSKLPRRPPGTDVIENQFYRVTVDKTTGRITVYDKELKRNVCKDMEIVAVEERGSVSFSFAELATGRTILSTVSRTDLEENSSVRAIFKISGHIADIPIVQRLILYAGLKRLDIENTVEWKGTGSLQLQQLFPLQQADAQIHYGVPFGANGATNIVPNSGPHGGVEVGTESWAQAREIQNWIFAGTSDWGLTIAADYHQVKFGDGVIRGVMLRRRPPSGTYHFKYSLSSAPGDWRSIKAYRLGSDFNNALIPVSVTDEISSKSLPPTHSFCSLTADNVVVSALKKTEDGAAIVLRLYETEGAQAQTSVQFLGEKRNFAEVNLLEEPLGQGEQQVLTVKPFEIRTVRLSNLRAHK